MAKSNSDTHKRSIATYTTEYRHTHQTKVSDCVTSSREKAGAFLLKAGIITKNGKVSTHYRSTLKSK